MKKSILILAVSAFYLTACSDSASDHVHSDGDEHSHEGSGDHHDHDHNSEQEDFIVDQIDSTIEDTKPNAVSKPDIVPTSKVIEEHVHDGHNHDHEGHKH